MPTKPLPAQPDLTHLKRQAKDLLRGHRSGDRAALQRLREFHPDHAGRPDADIAGATFTLGDAQWALAREYGFASWRRLREVVLDKTGPDLDLPFHERIDDPIFRRAVDLMDAGAVDRLRAHLIAHPRLARQRVAFDGGNYFQNPPLLAFVAENPVRHDKMPRNIADVARCIIEAGVDQDSLDETLGLVCSGRVARESGAQAPLIAVLAGAGADLNAAMLPALGHGEFAAVEALIAAGAKLDLPVAAATGRSDKIATLLADAPALARHQALALAAQHGHAAILRHLLEAGEDPDRYNPPGCDAHSTPLHQAALAGHLAVVDVLLSWGCATDLRDLHHKATPLDWSRHAGQDAITRRLETAETARSGAPN